MICTEEGSGLYGQYARVSDIAVRAHIPLVLPFIDSIPYDSRGPFRMCDYGSADGGPGMIILAEVVKKIKQIHGDQTEFIIIYEDQIFNDYKSLFKRVHGLLPVPDCLLSENVFSFASATSFYKRCCPTSSIHFGHTNFATMILSKSPCPLRNVIVCHLSEDPEEKRCFAEQAAQDWQTFLEMRAKELVPGGFLLVSTLAMDDEGHYTGHTQTVKYNMYEVITEVWKRMQNEGMITEEEFQAATGQYYAMSESELRAPFEDVSSSPHRLGLRLESCAIRHMDEYHFDSWSQEQGLDRNASESARLYAQTFVSSFRSYMKFLFLAALNDSRGDVDKTVILDVLFKRYEDVIAQDPTNHGKVNVVAALCIRKIQT